MAYEDAAKNIGAYFNDIDDKLLNMLQLKTFAENESNELVLASIEQKVAHLKSYSFQQAIDFKDLKAYLKYLLVPLSAVVFVFIISPKVLTESSNRILQFDQEFVEPAPFTFHIENDELKTLQYVSYDLKLRLEGEVIPKDVFVIKGGNKTKLKKIDKTHFQYTFSNPSKSIDFNLEALGFESQLYNIKVVPKPIVENFKVFIDYPKYLGKQSDELSNLGNFTVPEGSKVKWLMFTKNVQDLKFDFGDSAIQADKIAENQYSFETTLEASKQYSIIESNKDYESLQPALYYVNVVPDEYPSIMVNSYEDSLNIGTVYFTGDISDDHGFHSLNFYYKKKSDQKYQRQGLEIDRSLAKDQFYFVMDLKAFGFDLGTEIEYYFQVRDNDAIHGYKSRKTSLYTYRLKTKDEIIEEYKNVSASMKDNMQKSIEKALQLKAKIENLRDKMLSKKELSWADKKELEQIRKEQEELKKAMEKILEEKQKINKQRESIGDQEESILEKEEKLEKMLEDMMKDDVQSMMDKIQDLMDKMKKEDLMEEMDQMSQSNENTSENLEKLQELYKQLEFEYQYNEAIKKLQDLSDKQEQLAKETEEQSKDGATDEKMQEMQKKQEELDKKFEEFSKGMKDLEKLNKDLEKPNKSFDKNEKDQESIKQSMQQSKQSMQQQKGKQAAQQQKQAAKKMDDLAKKMQQQQDQMEMEQMALDYETLRQLLENVLTLSFDQEGLIVLGEELRRNSPSYSRMLLDQYKIKDNMRMVEDSLKSIAKRVFELESFITEEINKLNQSVDYAVGAYEQLKFSRGLTQQQYAMTSFNNIALMLNESLKNMQEKMSSQKQSSGSKACSKPKQGQSLGKGNKSKAEIEKMRQMNDKLTKQMQGMKKAGEQGKASSESIAKLAKQQAELRRMIEEFNQKHNKDGKKKFGNLEEILEKMEQNEKDIVNKKLSEEMYLRQEQITTRLLKAENAAREQEKKNEREAEQAKETETSEPPVYLEYKKKKERQVELLRSISPKFSPFYKKVVNEYFKAITN